MKAQILQVQIIMTMELSMTQLKLGRPYLLYFRKGNLSDGVFQGSQKTV